MADILTNAAEGLDKFLGNLGDVADRYLDLEQIIPGVSDLLIDQSSEIRKLNKELGNGSKLANELRGEFANLSKTIGVSTADIVGLLSVTKDYHQGLKSSTAYTLQFIKASGASSDVVGKLSARLNILNKASDKTFDAMYTNILAVRDAYGLTTDQIDSVINIVDKFAVTNQASNEQIEQGTIALAKFTSQLTSAGVEADKVTEILDSIIDPDQMMNNVALMSKLGITVNDMVSGYPIAKLEGSTEKLKQLGQEISNIAKSNRMQANEMAKVYGLTLEQANTLANMDTSEKALNTQKKLEEYRNEMATFAEGVEALKNTIGGFLSGPLSKIGALLETLGNNLGIVGKGLIGLAGIWLGKKLINALRSGLESVLGQAAKIMSKEMSKYLGGAQARLNAKETDSSLLSPKITKNAEKLGFGYSLKARVEEKEEAKRIKKLGKGKGIDKLETGELLEGLETYKKFLEDMQKRISELPVGSTERQFLEEKYRQSDAAIDLYNKTMAKFKDILNPKFRASDALQNYKNARGKNIQGAAKNLTQTFLGNDVFNNSVFQNKEAQKGIANVLKEGDFKTQKEALLAIKDFLNNSNFEGAAQGVVALNKELEDMESAAKNNQEAMEAARETMEGLSQAAKGSKIPLGNRLKAGFQGALGSIAGIAGKALIGGGIGLAVGALSKLVSGVGQKLSESLKNNEKFQKGMEQVSEKISGMFDGIASALEPLVDPIVNFITGFINFVQPALLGLANFIGGFGKKINKEVENISDSVSTIEDSYKKEDLKTMYRLEGAYDTENDTIIALLEKAVYKIDDVTKNQKENTNLQFAKFYTNNGNGNNG